MQTRTQKITVIAMLSALAYLVMIVGRIPVVLFLKYDPKDAIITICGFLYGPLSSFAMSAVVSLVEMFTVSDTGPIGLVMNIISSCSFACTAAFIYKKKHSLNGAVIGLVAGCLLTTAVMLLWNYFITPIYMGVPRSVVAGLLVPACLPFNLLKGSLNGAITMLLYKPVSMALRKSRLIAIDGEANGNTETGKGKINMGVMLISLFVLATCILLVLVLQGGI